MSNFSKILKDLRKEKGFTQAELGFLLQVSTRAINSWEQGSRTPSFKTVVELAELFDVPYVVLCNPLIADIKKTPLTC